MTIANVFETSLVKPSPKDNLVPTKGLSTQVKTVVLDTVIDKLAWLGSVQPGANPEVYGVDVVKDVRYYPGASRDNLLDVYMPRNVSGPRPVVLYVHGGGFRLLSKDTHWMMAIAYARRGYVVFNINYRLAPEHPFPAAPQDVSRAYLWMLDNAHRFGGDPSRRVVAGESAGANLVTSLAIQTVTRRPEPWAEAVFDADAVPHAVVASCGIFQMTEIRRLWQDNKLLGLVGDWLEQLETGYVGAECEPGSKPLADPLLILEGDQHFERELPPFFASVGSADPLELDTRRLSTALARRGVTHRAEVYDGESHAFQMMTWRRAAKSSWANTFTFLKDHLPADPEPKSNRPVRRRSLAERARTAIIDALAA